MTYRLGVDIGGTFTDFAVLHPASGRLATHKQLTTPEDPSIAVLAGLDTLLSRESIQISSLSEIIHGTTLVTNATIERKGARVCMLVTAGFADVLALAKETRYDLYDLRLRFATPVVPRSLRLEVEERVRYDGKVMTPINVDSVRDSLNEFRKTEEIAAVAICFLHSYANPDHERKIKEMLQKEHPDLHVSVSSEIAPVMREYERWTTTTINAYNQPMVDRYLSSLETGLSNRGFAGKFHLMTSNGGTITSEAARLFPVRLMESGPAAGVLMSARHGRQLGLSELLSFDMGGTTSKGALLSDFAPHKHYQLEVARSHNFKRGSGLPILIPVIDMIEIGTGGGSIASVDKRGVLRAGPSSAGARPGPACYGQGGSSATLTDANLLLGYLDAEFFLGGKMNIDSAAAESVLNQEIGKQLSLSVTRVAWGIHETANEDVARAFRVHAAERGFDYRTCSMVAFGGSGPIHAMRIARKLHIPRVIFPAGAGVMSAFGLLVSPMNNEAVRTAPILLDKLSTQEFDSRFLALDDEAAKLIEHAGIPRSEISLTRRLDMRYRGQGYQITVELPQGVVGKHALGLIAKAFEIEYRKIFAITFGTQPLEIVDWKVEATGPQPSMPENGFQLSDMAARSKDTACKGSRKAWFPEAGDFVDCLTYDRYAFSPGDKINGPALIEDKESTCVIGIGESAQVDAMFNLIVSVALTQPEMNPEIQVQGAVSS